MNSIASPYELAPNEARECMNVVSTERGAIRKRYGSTEFSKSNPNTEMTSLATVNVTAGLFLIVSNGKEIWSVDTSGTMVEIGKGFTAGSRWSIVQANKGTAKTAGPVYLQNGVDAPQYWTGAEAKTLVKEWESEKVAFEGKEMFSTAPYTPKGKYMIFANERVWIAGTTGDTSAVRFSELKSIGEGGEQPDPTLWPKNNVVRFDPEDGDAITGLGVVGPYVLVFKPNKIWVIHNAAPIATRKISDSIGCVSHRSIVETAQGTFFLTAEQGVYLTDGSKLHELSYQVRPTILAVNPAKRENAAGAYLSGHYYLSFASGSNTVNNRTLDYDTQLKSWWPHDLAGNQWAIYESVAGEPFLYTLPGKAKAGVVKAFDPTTYQDSGVNYVGNETLGAFWYGPWEPFAYFVFRHRLKAPFIKKRVRQVHFDASGEVVALVFKNFSNAGSAEPGVVGKADQSKPETPINFEAELGSWGGTGTWGGSSETAVWAGNASTADARLYALGVARVWSVGWGNNSKNGFEVDSYMMAVSFRKS